jgi:sterol desaturase/sphingolipid hydroxylase (fatty acid hydroxylase superfamily)
MSIPVRAAQMIVIGVDSQTLWLWQTILFASILFHHSNARLPLRVERVLVRLIVTPRMHGIHHSIVQRETNSNWGTVFCWWDKLHRTLRRDIPQDAITIGVASYREEHELTLGKLWALPFGKQREWRLPNGEKPERAPRDVNELAE